MASMNGIGFSGPGPGLANLARAAKGKLHPEPMPVETTQFPMAPPAPMDQAMSLLAGAPAEQPVPYQDPIDPNSPPAPLLPPPPLVDVQSALSPGEQEAQALDAANTYAATHAQDGRLLSPAEVEARHRGNVNLDLGTLGSKISGRGAQSRKEYADANEQLNMAQGEKVAAEQKAEHVNDPFLAEKAQVAEREIHAQQQFEKFQTETMNDILASSKMVRDKSLEMMNEHPEKIWSNATTGGKIAGIFGLVAAGLGTEGANHRLNDMVNEAVAVQERKNKYLKQTGEANETLLATAQKVFTSERAAHEATKAAMFESIDARLKFAMQATKDPIALANFQVVQAENAKKLAEVREKSFQAENSSLISLASQQVGLQKAEAMIKARAALGQDHKISLPGITGPDGQPVQFDNRDQNVRKFAEQVGNGADFLGGMNEMDKLLKKYRGRKLTDEEGQSALTEYNALMQNMQGPYKNLYGYGGAFTALEKEPLLALMGSLPLVASDLGFLNRINDAKMNAGRNVIFNHMEKMTRSMTGDKGRLNRNDPFWSGTQQAIDTYAAKGSGPASAEQPGRMTTMFNTVLGRK